MIVPSLQTLFDKALKTLLRFPLTMLFAVVGVGFTLFLIFNNIEPAEDLQKVNLIATSGLGLSLFFSIHISLERMKVPRWQKWLIVLAGFIFLCGIYFTLPLKNDAIGSKPAYLRLFVFFVCTHLLAAFIPFINNKNLNGFWQYNRTLFIRLLTSALFSGVLFLGLTLALVAINQLFDVKINDKIYPEMWVVIAGIFNTWMFLSGVPKFFEELDDNKEYPKGLRIFAQYILLPLLALYVLILYAYGTKIILLWNWPKGIISYLVICVAAVGSLSFLLLYPYGETEEHRWIKKAGRFFYILMLPLMVLLFIAISMRLNDYGITMHRYIIFMMGIWLTLVCLYTISGRPNIRFIPVSLSIFLLISLFGPWSMFSVSEHSQVNRLEKMLTKSGILKNGKIVNENLQPSGKANAPDNLDGMKNNTKMNDSLRNEAGSILSYLNDIDRLHSVNKWFSQNMDSLKKNVNRYSVNDLYLNAMGLQKESGLPNSTSEPEFEKSLDFETSNEMNVIPVKGYDQAFQIISYELQDKETPLDSFYVNGTKYLLKFTDNDHAGIILNDGKNDVTVLLDSLIDKREAKGQAGNQDEMTVSATSKSMDIKYFIKEMSVYKNCKGHPQNKYQISKLNGWLLIRMKQ